MKPRSQALDLLTTQRYPIGEEVWAEFWDGLEAKDLAPGEALGVVASLTSRIPDGETVSNLLASLRARNPQPEAPERPTVNIVGTGGGPSTFNLSTASAFVGAAIGARVVKTGSRAYSSRTGSVDLLDRLGVKMTRDAEATAAMLDEFGIACCGPYVYPKELARLARAILPFGMKTVGRFFNLVGPFLAAIPVTVQITGTSDTSVLPTFEALTAEHPGRKYWVTSNELGVDEMLSIAPSRIYDSEKREEFTLDPAELGLADRPFEDLHPVENLDETVPHFLALLGGDGPQGALESIQLNAAALAMHGGVVEDLQAGIKLAADAMAAGEPVKLVERIRAGAGAPAS